VSRSGEITLEWADGEYTFRIGIGECKKLQERVDRGPYDVFERLSSRKFFIEEITETIRLGLVGGSSCRTAIGTPDDARIRKLIRDYVEERPWVEGQLLAARILDAALSGAPDELVPKPKAKESQPQSSPEESSPSPLSTDGGQSLDIAPAISMP